MNAEELRHLLNQTYRPLEAKCTALIRLLKENGYDVSYGYYNGHYHKDTLGNYTKDDFPIPVISVKGLCDMEIDLAGLSLSTKLAREKALEYDFTKLSPFSFEVYGVEEYLHDYYNSDMTLAQLRENLSVSQESEIGFGFSFAPTITPAELLLLVDRLHADGFYY